MGGLLIGGATQGHEGSERKFTPMDIDSNTSVATTISHSAESKRGRGVGEASGQTQEEECEDCKDL
jgi:hypothetical protein